MNYTYPGVYIVEQPSSAHNIVGVATSIAAFVGYTASGIENTAVELFSWGDFVRNFGGLASNSELSYAVQQFFANGGSNCFVVRIPKHNAVAGKLVIGDINGNAALTLSAISSGTWSGSLTVEVDYDNILPTATTNLPGTVTLTNSTTVTPLSAAAASALAIGNWVAFNADPTDTPYQIATVTPEHHFDGRLFGPTTGSGAGQVAAAGWSLLVGYDRPPLI